MGMKTSSVWNKEKDHKDKGEAVDSSASEMKNKPVLTEEMERSIIYGGFKKKEDKNVKKETREDKLIAVRREIEARFKAEEERRRKISEEKRKAEEKEKERMRIAEEKLKRQVIYGGFKKKEDKTMKKEDKNVKKETREDKLIAVRREIEARFKAEEERRRKISEEKRKAEE